MGALRYRIRWSRGVSCSPLGVPVGETLGVKVWQIAALTLQSIVKARHFCKRPELAPAGA